MTPPLPCYRKGLLLPSKDLCKTLFRGVFGLIILQRPPLSFGHFPRERGNPDSFAKVSGQGRGEGAVAGVRGYRAKTRQISPNQTYHGPGD